MHAGSSQNLPCLRSGRAAHACVASKLSYVLDSFNLLALPVLMSGQVSELRVFCESDVKI